MTRGVRPRKPLTQARARELFDYDPESGELTTKPQPVSTSRYKLVDGVPYPAHHVIWLWMTGELPPLNVEVDHVDRNKLNNAWGNLRLATRSQNSWNKGVYRSNTSGFKGVSLDKNVPGRWRASIRIMGRSRHLGSFGTREEAARAYDRGALEYHGEFAVTNESLGLLPPEDMRMAA